MKKLSLILVAMILSSMIEMAQESLNVNFTQIGKEFELKYQYKKYDRVLVKNEALKLFDQFVNFPLVQDKEWLASFKKEFKNLSKDGQTFLTIPLLRELKEFPGAKEITQGKNFRVMQLNTQIYYIDYGNYSRPKIIIPEIFIYGISFKIDGKEYVWFAWDHVPSKYLYLYPKNERPY